MSAVRIDADFTAPEGRVVVVGGIAAMGSPRLWLLPGLTGAYERDYLPGVDYGDAGDDLPVDRLKAHWRVGPDGVSHGFEELLEPRHHARPGPVEERDERVAQSGGQRLLGHTASATTLIIAPAIAALTPFRNASWASTRAKNDGDSVFDSVDMAMPFCAREERFGEELRWCASRRRPRWPGPPASRRAR
jgi:hypothetical protein